MTRSSLPGLRSLVTKPPPVAGGRERSSDSTSREPRRASWQCARSTSAALLSSKSDRGRIRAQSNFGRHPVHPCLLLKQFACVSAEEFFRNLTICRNLLRAPDGIRISGSARLQTASNDSLAGCKRVARSYSLSRSFLPDKWRRPIARSNRSFLISRAPLCNPARSPQLGSASICTPSKSSFTMA